MEKANRKKEPKAKKEPKTPNKAKGKKAAAAPAYRPAYTPPQKKSGKLVSVLILAALVLGVVFLVRMAMHESSYKSAQLAIDKGSYEKAQESLDALGDYKDARVLRTYALARWLYSASPSTGGSVLDQIDICLSAIPDDYSGDMAQDVSKFKEQFGTYHRLWTNYKQSGAQSDNGSVTGSSVKHNGNFYTAFGEFYESAAHFWDEDAS